MNKETELRILRNFIRNMPKVYRQRNMNWVIVMDLLMQGTSTSGGSSCMSKCRELGMNPYGYRLEDNYDV